MVTLAGPLAQALAAAHARGAVHGDVTPANVLFAADGRPLLADLGLARAAGEAGLGVAGTPEYLDPTVAAGGTPTPAGDVHGLAGCCYHALTGRPPFEGPSAAATLAVAAEGRHVPLAALAPDVPTALTALVEQGLHVDPERRPSAEAFAAAVFRACPAATVRLDQAAPVLAAAPLTHEVLHLPPPPDPSAAPRGWRRIVRPQLLGAVVVALLLGGVGLGLGLHALQAGGRDMVTAPAAPSPSRPVDLIDADADLAAVYEALTAARDEAFARASPALLSAAYSAGSPAREADAGVVAALAARGAHAEGLAHRTHSVVVRERSADRAVLAVIDELPAYRVVDAGGTVLAERPGRGQQAFTVALRRGAQGWRIETVVGA